MNSSGFTVFELIVVISIGALLLLFAIAPYNHYADTSRVRMTAERIEQLQNKAKLLAGTGYAPGDGTKNLDLVVHIEVGSSTLVLESLPAGSFIKSGESGRKKIEAIPTESRVEIARIGENDTLPAIDIVYRSPLGRSEIWDVTTTPTRIDTHPPTE